MSIDRRRLRRWRLGYEAGRAGQYAWLRGDDPAWDAGWEAGKLETNRTYGCDA